jgi:hypothetical protein
MIGNQLYDASRVDAAGTDVTVVVDVAVAVSVSVVVIADGVTVMVERVVIKSWKMLVETEGSVCVRVDTCCIPVNGKMPYRVSDRVVMPVTAVSVVKVWVDKVVVSWPDDTAMFRTEAVPLRTGAVPFTIVAVPFETVAVPFRIETVPLRANGAVMFCAETAWIATIAAAKNLTNNIIQDCRKSKLELNLPSKSKASVSCLILVSRRNNPVYIHFLFPLHPEALRERADTGNQSRIMTISWRHVAWVLGQALDV